MPDHRFLLLKRLPLSLGSHPSHLCDIAPTAPKSLLHLVVSRLVYPDVHGDLSSGMGADVATAADATAGAAGAPSPPPAPHCISKLLMYPKMFKI